MKNIAFVILRVTLGSLMAGHGAQKLFGWFGGPGMAGFTGMLKAQGFRPARSWALLGACSEFGGGLLTALGLLNPLGPLGVMGAMSMATTKVHWGKPIWNQAGGAELPLTNIGLAAALALAEPDAYSLDRLLGIRIPRWVLLPGVLAGAATLAAGLWISRHPQPGAAQSEAAPPEQEQATTVPTEPPPAGEEPTWHITTAPSPEQLEANPS